jgi:hypothetical protein
MPTKTIQDRIVLATKLRITFRARIFKEIKGDAKGLMVTPEHLLRAADELNLAAEIGRIIAELKGGGIISPCLRDPSHLLYEINPSLIEKDAT